VTEETVFTGSFDGIIGLAYPQMAEPNLTPFFETVMRSNLIDSNIFAFYMSMNPQKDDSELTFGWYDSSRFLG
jgi:cathepsin D